jgi:Arm DNA-binding domain
VSCTGKTPSFQCNIRGGTRSVKLNKDAVYRAAKVQQKDYKISDGGGLSLMVKTDGTKRWLFYYRFEGKQNTLGLGTYPDTTLENAMRQTENALKQIADGIDPCQIKKAAKEAKKLTLANEKLLARLSSFEHVARLWLA